MTFPPFVSPWGSVTYASIDGNTLYLAHSVVNNAPGIFYTSDGGATWTAMDPTLFGGNDPAIFLSYNPQIVITSEWFVINYYYSNDDGATWQQGTITAAPGSNLPASYSVNALHRVGTRLFLATNSGHAVSNDNGQTWTFVQPGFNLTQFCGWDSRVVAIENHWSGKRLHESTDGGLTWTQINGAFPTHADGRINPSAMTNVGNTIMCQNIPLDETVANPRVLYTLSENGDWTAAPSLGVLDYDITFISGTALDQFYVITVGGGVWKNSTGVGLVEVNKQNDWKIFPNPAVNNITFINDNGRVKNYRIYSITGALCASGQITQAQQNISVDALTSGVYEFVVIDDNGIMSTQTIMKH
jgi:hypothetical protein